MLRIQPSRHSRGLSRMALVTATFLGYGLTRHVFVQTWPMIDAVALIPVSATGWAWGIWSAVAAGVLVELYKSLVDWLAGGPFVFPQTNALPGVMVMFLSGIAAGWAGGLVRRVRAQAQSLCDSEAQMKLLFSQIPALLWTTDRNLSVTSGMGAVLDTSQRLKPQSEIIGCSIYDLHQTTDPSSPPVAAHLTALSGQAASYEYALHGRLYQCRVEPFISSVGEAVGTIGVGLDISERKGFETQLQHLADCDFLTQLLNRRALQEELDALLARAGAASNGVALLFLDLDGFKYINDSMGHHAGDEFLRSFAAVLRTEMQGVEGVRLARLGGDEFAVVLPDCHVEQARMIGEMLVGAVRRHVTVIRGRPVSASVSIGVAAFPDHGETGEELLAFADLAMFETKDRGRNGVSIYQPENGRRTQSELKLEWESRIRSALDEGRFLLYAQPILDLASGSLSHYELLLRMKGEDGSLILPGAFLDVAERFGLIRAIDRWVLCSAIALSARLQAGGHRVRLTVNLSAKAFTDEGLLAIVLHEIAVTGADPAYLVLEITETALVADTRQAREWIEALRKVGFRFAVDDFGAGFWSFAHLRRLPVDYLKIDGSFITGLVDDPVDQHLVRSMVEMAIGMGMKTIAEFVGDDATQRMVAACGVDYAQGYHIGRPCPLQTIWPELETPVQVK